MYFLYNVKMLWAILCLILIAVFTIISMVREKPKGFVEEKQVGFYTRLSKKLLVLDVIIFCMLFYYGHTILAGLSFMFIPIFSILPLINLFRDN